MKIALAPFICDALICNPFNLDGLHSRMEMLLSELFDSSFIRSERQLIATNGLIEYTYTKGPSGNSMQLRVISCEIPSDRFKVRFGGSKPFPLNKFEHPLLDLSELV